MLRPLQPPEAEGDDGTAAGAARLEQGGEGIPPGLRPAEVATPGNPRQVSELHDEPAEEPNPEPQTAGSEAGEAEGAGEEEAGEIAGTVPGRGIMRKLLILILLFKLNRSLPDGIDIKMVLFESNLC